jgi:hypothetical protein
MNALADHAAVFTCIKGFNTAILNQHPLGKEPNSITKDQLNA